MQVWAASMSLLCKPFSPWELSEWKRFKSDPYAMVHRGSGGHVRILLPRIPEASYADICMVSAVLVIDGNVTEWTSTLAHWRTKP